MAARISGPQFGRSMTGGWRLEGQIRRHAPSSGLWRVSAEQGARRSGSSPARCNALRVAFAPEALVSVFAQGYAAESRSGVT